MLKRKNNQKWDRKRLRYIAAVVILLMLAFILAGCSKKEPPENQEEPQVQEELEEDNSEEIKVDPFSRMRAQTGVRRILYDGRSRMWQPDWSELRGDCEDIIGWIICDDSVMDYPIAQGEDNDYYLYTTNYGVTDGVGIPFVDFRCEKPFKGFLTVLYGHRMRNGTMFKHISNYFYEDGEDFYDRYHIYKIYTPTHSYALKIFAWARVSETDGNTYDFELCTGKETRWEKQEYLDYVESINQLEHPKYKATVDDHLVMMSTCTAELDEDREVVWGKLEIVR